MSLISHERKYTGRVINLDIDLVRFPDGRTGVFPHLLDRYKPGVIGVLSNGKRFTNESNSYHDVGAAMIEACAQLPETAMWLVCDRRALGKYGLGYVKPAPLPIGGFTAKDAIPIDPPGLTPLVPANHRSPFSRGSQDLPSDLTPIKPEVLFEAGNMLVDGADYCGIHPAVSLLALSSDVENEPLMPFNATSAAAGVAGNFTGQLQAELPDLWPETYRALMVDSATWPQPIRSQLVGRGAHWKSISKGKRQLILRDVGYGVPDLERAFRSARNDVTLIAQAEIQPFAAGPNGQAPVFNEMHFYDLPWPSALLQELENETVTLKVTLSYFIEPNLSGRAATRPDTYRSFGLRFEMKKRTETAAGFRRRLTQPRDHDEPTANEGSHWLLGPNAFQAGSLHCDLWRGAAVDLASHDEIAVYPVGGWWKSHTGQQRMNDKGRYALILSIDAPGQAVDLHARIAAMVEAKQAEIQAALVDATGL